MNSSPQPCKDRWQHASCLQKAIRRNHPEWALPSAHFLWGWSPRYLIRRLAVIAFEDIGLANLDLVESYLQEAHRILHDRHFDDAARERVLEFVGAFCASLKSRYLTRIGATVHYHPRYKALTAQYHDAILTDKVNEAAGETDVLRTQALALTCHPDELAKVLVAEGHERLPNLMRLGGRLGCKDLPRILFATRNEKPVDTVTTSLPEPRPVGHFPLWVYDKHTRLGARALRAFVGQVPELAHLTPETALWFAYRAIFRFESGLLDREVMFTHDKDVEAVWWETLMVEDLALPEVLHLRDVIRERLPELDAIRATYLGHFR